MKKYNIAVVPLDGIGKQLHPIGVDLLKKTQEIAGGFELDFQWYEAGVEYAIKTGRGRPENFYEDMCAADAMFCGSCGHFDEEMAKTDYPEFHIGMIAQFFRGGMGNTIGLRPLTLMPGVPTPLANRDKIDIYLLRELAEAGYISPGKPLCSDQVVYDLLIATRATTEKLAHYAYNVARNRSGRVSDGRKVVTLGTKIGAFAILDFYAKVFREIAPQYPDIETQYLEIDALCDHIVKAPDRFDVVVCENMCGDIVSDIGACVTGGMGITPTADVGGITPHFRPNHGTFPRAVGKNFANPVATMVTCAIMLETLGNDHDDEALRAGAKLIREAVAQNFATGGPKTVDLGGNSSTDEVTKAIFGLLDKSKT